MTQIAVKQGYSRAHHSIMNLLKLDQSIQVKLQKLSDPIEILLFSERRLRKMSAITNRKFQITAFDILASQMKSKT
jgi:hypothetical protein